MRREKENGPASGNLDAARRSCGNAKKFITISRRRYLKLFSLALTGRLVSAASSEVEPILRVKQRIQAELREGEK